GAHAFTITLNTPGTQSITVTDTTNPHLTAQTAVTVSQADHFIVSSPPSITAGSSSAVAVMVIDTTGDIMTDFAGTVHFTSTDPQAVLPADYTFSSSDAGQHTFNVTLKTAGAQSITVSMGGVTGSVIEFVNPSATVHLNLSVPSGATAGAMVSATV